MFIEELKKQFPPEQVAVIQKMLEDAIISYDKENGTYHESVWEGANIYQFLTGKNLRKHSPYEASYYLAYWKEDLESDNDKGNVFDLEEFLAKKERKANV